jgi:signal transduction histidine kinase/CheY-like chemotaxis protein
MEAILESMAEGILEIDDRKIVYANAAAISLFGVPEEKILISYPPDLFDTKSQLRVGKLLKSSTTSPAEIGENTPLDLHGRQVTIQNIPVSQTTSIMLITDVTERKRLEMQLQHAQKMEAVGTIAGGVAHNFRNTLAGIQVNSQVIQENYPDHAALIEIVERINTAVKRGAHLVDRLMQFSRKNTKEELQPLDLLAILAETYQLARKSFPNKIDIKLDLHESLSILGDHAGLSQVFMNIFNNARDAMPDGGLIKIEARRENGMAVITVSDSGRGMDKQTRERCFDPFFTTKEIGKGTGLGLSTTYGIVKSHEGEILVESEPGKGTTFKLRFPLSKTDDLVAQENSGRIVLGKGEHILVVDDELDIQAMMQDFLECLGYQPFLASKGEEALNSYETWRPEVVLMDVNLPEMDGITCAEKIMAVDPEAKIAILSAENSKSLELANERVSKCIKGYLAKPVDIAKLSALLAKLVGS